MADLDKIDSIEKLVQKLDLYDTSEYAGLFPLLDLSPAALEAYAFFSLDKYTRNCVARTDRYELLLLCWEPGQETKVHCHNRQECWVYVAEGQLEEERFSANDLNGLQMLTSENDLKLASEKLSYMSDQMGYHLLRNTHQGRAMTLHLYAGPIERCRIYNTDTKQFEWVDLKYYSQNGQVLETISQA